MSTPLEKKSTTDEIRERFDNDVERFSQLETGQSATMDAPLVMELITSAAVATTSPIRRVLDIGCGGGNNTIKLRQQLGSDFTADLLDLSEPMVMRAAERVGVVNSGPVYRHVTDFRDAELPAGEFDVILAAAVLHHLRDDYDWRAAFEKIYSLLAPGGSVWITDLVTHETSSVDKLMWSRYAAYLTELGGEDYQRKVFDYIEKEDSPRPVTFQLDLFRSVGFSQVDLLHKNSCFAAFGAVK
ncbi:class I SAM-dependent methyltransferase [Calycomorphotria hydatis]|nr:class I SAM-dependent methyltransferase [Calycomorphotria hydatis]